MNTSPSPIANTLLGVFLVVTLMSGCQPAALPEETVPPGAAAEENPGDLGDLGDLGEMDALGDIEVDRGLFFVDVVLPAEFSEGITQESLDSDLAENGFRSATLNDDGSVTYTMTKAKHDEVLAELRESIQESANEFIADEPDTYTSIEFDKNLSTFTVLVNGANFSGEAPWLEFSLAFPAGFYYILAGTTSQNQTFTVTYVDDSTGEALATSTWPQED